MNVPITQEREAVSASEPITYGSVCSGIEAPSSAWHPLGWKPLWFSEIEPFPKAVLAHHYPDVPDLGDMTALPGRILAGEVPAPDVFVGGTPCQSFSVAGLRKGLADPRGQLTRTFVEILDALDTVRTAAGKPPAVALWENVPGVLSDKDNAFGNFLAALVGEDDALLPPGGRWSNCGCVLGPTRVAAWRVLDAQYFGVAQRRRRVFVVVSARSSGVDPVEVLLVEQGVRRDTPPSREAWQGSSSVAARGADGGGRERGAGSDGAGGGRGGGVVAPPLTATNDPSRSPQSAEVTAQVEAVLRATYPAPRTQNWDGQDTAPTLAGRLYGGLGAQTMPDKGNLGAVLQPNTVIMAHGQANAEVRTDGAAPTLVCVHEAPIVAFEAHAVHENQRAEVTLSPVVGTLKCAGGKPGQGYPTVLASVPSAVPRAVPQRVGVFQQSSMNGKGTIGYAEDNLAKPVKTQADGQMVVLPSAVPYDLFQVTAPLNRQSRDESSPCHTLARDNAAHAAVVLPPAVHFDVYNHKTTGDLAGIVREQHGTNMNAVLQPTMSVRRLTPVECEALQGFSRNFTRIPWKGKPAEQCPDGPRYRALGNSMAVPVIRWIGVKLAERIALAASRRAH